MKIITNTACLAICFALLYACQPGKSEIDPVITVPFESSNAIDLGQFIDRANYIQLENQPESAFTDIDKMIVTGSNMFMLDKRLEAVFCFDTTGRFRYRIQRVGRGPGEYRELDAMWVKQAEGELWLQSFWPSKIMVYNLDGLLLREYPIRWSARDMVRIGGGKLAGYNASRSNDGVDSLREGIFLLDESGNSLGQSKVLGDGSIYWSLAYQRNLEEFGNGALLLSQSDTIFEISADGDVSPDVFLDWGKLRFPKDLSRICYDSPRAAEVVPGKYVLGKDQLVAFGPIRLFRIMLEDHMELAMADLNSRKGFHSTQITSNIGRVPLLYPLTVGNQDQLFGIYDMNLLMAMKESQSMRQATWSKTELYQAMDSLVESALKQDRPVLWMARIKQEWLTKSY